MDCSPGLSLGMTSSESYSFPQIVRAPVVGVLEWFANLNPWLLRDETPPGTPAPFLREAERYPPCSGIEQESRP